VTVRRVILNADDLGYDPAVSRGIVTAMRSGVVSSTTLMVNTPFSALAAGLAKDLAVGLHLNLVRFEAVSTGEALVEAAVASLSAQFVEAETLAQLERLQQLTGAAATHVDVHKHAHLHAPVLEGLARAALKQGLPVRSISAPMRAALRGLGVRTNDVFLGDAGASAFWTPEELERQLDLVPAEGVVELMCHPGYAPTHVSSGYSSQRLVEFATFTAPAARAALAKRGIVLESWSGV
jgi:predicted glycoside hydrolase/deacetylase ChbG (UPF0249 family)